MWALEVQGGLPQDGQSLFWVSCAVTVLRLVPGQQMASIRLMGPHCYPPSDWLPGSGRRKKLALDPASPGAGQSGSQRWFQHPALGLALPRPIRHPSVWALLSSMGLQHGDGQNRTLASQPRGGPHSWQAQPSHSSLVSSLVLRTSWRTTRFPSVLSRG